jgi:hypothetical protein
MSAAGPSRGRLRERGGRQAQSARPLALAAADSQAERMAGQSNEAANCAPSGGGEAARAASVGAHIR